MTNSREVSLGSAFAFVKCQPRQSRCWKTQRNWAIIGSNLPIITRSLSALLRNYCFAGVFMWSRWELRRNYCVGFQQRRDRSVTKVNMKYHHFCMIIKSKHVQNLRYVCSIACESELSITFYKKVHCLVPAVKRKRFPYQFNNMLQSKCLNFKNSFNAATWTMF